MQMNEPKPSDNALSTVLQSLQRPEMIASLTNDDLLDLEYDWPVWARPEQLPPEGDWQFWPYIGGRGAGKTRTGAEYVRNRVAKGYKRIALVAPTHDDFDKVMVGGESGILACSPSWDMPEYNESKKTLTWPNGAKAFGYSAEKPERLRGPQHDCFVAGTMVSTPFGQVPIEQIKIDDYVLTRKGYRRVTATKSRQAVVGKVLFSNDSFLLGTATHPIYTPNGWVAMGNLHCEDTVCAIDASSSAVKNGIDTEKDGAHTTNEQINQLSRNASCCYTGQYGNTITGPLKKATTYTTLITTWRTTLSAISNAYHTANTAVCTTLAKISNAIGTLSPYKFYPAQDAVVMLNGNLQDAKLYANRVSTNEQKKNVRSFASVNNAAPNLNHVPETSAVKVASTWQREAVQTVYCFTVEGEHEYFANGVLVHNCSWCDEIAAWHPKRRQDTWDMLMFGMRLGDNPTTMVSTTPIPVGVIRDLMQAAQKQQPGYVLTSSSTYANRRNLSKQFFSTVIKKYEGTRLGEQELLGKLLMDIPGALWSMENINPYRLPKLPNKLKRVVVAVDPSGAHDTTQGGTSARDRENAASQEKNDEIGIVVAAEDYNDEYYVLDDASLLGGPDIWTQAAVDAYYDYGATSIIAETNYGGGMVINAIKRQDKDVRVKAVTASRGKAVRAAPIALLYEQGRVHHVGKPEKFAKLEDQFCKFTASGYTGSKSPDRADAAIWALSELSGQTGGRVQIMQGHV